MKVSFWLFKVVCVLSCVWSFFLRQVRSSLALQLSILPTPTRPSGDPTSQIFLSLPYLATLKSPCRPYVCTVHHWERLQTTTVGKVLKVFPSPPSWLLHPLTTYWWDLPWVLFETFTLTLPHRPGLGPTPGFFFCVLSLPPFFFSSNQDFFLFCYRPSNLSLLKRHQHQVG